MGNALMVFVVPNGRDQCCLAIGPALPPNSCPCRCSASPSVTADQQPPFDLLTIGQRYHGFVRGDLLCDHGLAMNQTDRRMGLHLRQKGCVKMPVLDHMAHRTFGQLGAVEVQEQRTWPLTRPAIAGLDLQDRLRLVGDQGPDAHTLQQSARGQRQRIGAAIKARLGAVRRRAGVDQGDRQTSACQSQGQSGAVQAPANDQNTVFHADDYGAGSGIVHGRRAG